MLYAALVALIWVGALYVFFLAYVTLEVAKRNGKLAAAPLPVRALAWAILIIALALDVAFNLIIGSLLFLERPRGFTFTQRCSAHMASYRWRGRLARWVCTGWLNPFDDDHCEGGA